MKRKCVIILSNALVGFVYTVRSATPRDRTKSALYAFYHVEFVILPVQKGIQHMCFIFIHVYVCTQTSSIFLLKKKSTSLALGFRLYPNKHANMTRNMTVFSGIFAPLAVSAEVQELHYRLPRSRHHPFLSPLHTICSCHSFVAVCGNRSWRSFQRLRVAHAMLTGMDKTVTHGFSADVLPSLFECSTRIQHRFFFKLRFSSDWFTAWKKISRLAVAAFQAPNDALVHF